VPQIIREVDSSRAIKSGYNPGALKPGESNPTVKLFLENLKTSNPPLPGSNCVQPGSNIEKADNQKDYPLFLRLHRILFTRMSLDIL
jgi:hypothetical protein